MPTHEEDMTFRHYQPAGRTTICGAIRRVIIRADACEVGTDCIRKVLKTTDLARVNCPHCQACIRALAAAWIETGN